MSQMSGNDFMFEEPRSQSNTLGLVGFILAFCLSPIGLILSLIAMFKAPRGFAIAGVVVGLVGTALWVVVGGGIFFFAGVALKAKQVSDQLTMVQSALESAKTPDGAYPSDLSGVAAGADPWGNPLVYERTPDTKGYLLTSTGPDGKIDTADDIPTTEGLPADVNMALAIMGISGDFAGSMGGDKAGQAVQAGSRMLLLTLRLGAINENGADYPEKLDGLPGLSPKLLNDPWGTPLVYTRAADGKTFSLRSNGPDKQPGTADDIDSRQITGEFERARARARQTSGVGGGGGN